MKKIFKKLVATILTTAAFLCTSSTRMVIHAVPPKPPAIFTTTIPYPYSNEVVLKRINDKIKEFESLAPGVFFVDPSFKDPKTTNLRISYQLIAQITEIFKRFPHIVSKLVEQVETATESKKFEIKPLTEEVHAQTAYLNDFCPEEVISGLYQASDAIKVFINIPYLHLLSSNPCLYQNCTEQTLSFNGDYTPCCITHEVGHVFSYVIGCCMFPPAFKDLAETTNALNKVLQRNPELLKNRDKKSNISEYQRLSRICKYDYILHSKIKDNVMEIAKKRYAYVGDGTVSEYSKNSPSDWIAEVFVDAVCSKNPSALGMAMLEYIDTYKFS